MGCGASKLKKWKDDANNIQKRVYRLSNIMPKSTPRKGGPNSISLNDFFKDKNCEDLLKLHKSLTSLNPDSNYIFDTRIIIADSFGIIDSTHQPISIVNSSYLEEGAIYTGFRRWISKDYKLEFFEV